MRFEGFAGFMTIPRRVMLYSTLPILPDIPESIEGLPIAIWRSSYGYAITSVKSSEGVERIPDGLWR